MHLILMHMLLFDIGGGIVNPENTDTVVEPRCIGGGAFKDFGVDNVGIQSINLI